MNIRLRPLSIVYRLTTNIQASLNQKQRETCMKEAAEGSWKTCLIARVTNNII